jgi:hypothetical protein
MDELQCLPRGRPAERRAPPASIRGEECLTTRQGMPEESAALPAGAASVVMILVARSVFADFDAMRRINPLGRIRSCMTATCRSGIVSIATEAQGCRPWNLEIVWIMKQVAVQSPKGKI